MEKIKVLILNAQYLPAYKGGGPIQSCVNMVENLSNSFDFYVLCADRDLKEKEAYPEIEINKWNRVGSAKVFYMSPEMQSLRGFEKLLNCMDYDVLYLNGFFSPIFTIRPLLLRRLRKQTYTDKVILTPRGDFTGGCENKKLKKYAYIYLMKLFGLYHGVLWHATSEMEQKDILKKFPKAATFRVPNLSVRFVPKKAGTPKTPGELRLVFVSRVFPKKNIKYALEVLKEIKVGKVIFDIYGPMEDEAYWNECEKLIRKMPQSIKVRYYGEAEHGRIPQIFEKYHAFLFPTLGENYGHVIVEAMMNNCLCILSKGVTPWDDYIEKIGIGALLKDKKKFVEDINKLIAMDNNEFQQLLEITSKYIENNSYSEDSIQRYKDMFRM